MKLKECTPGMLLKTKSNKLVEVHTVQYGRVKAKVLYPLTKTPQFEEYGEEALYHCQLPSPELLGKYEKALEERRSKKKKKN